MIQTQLSVLPERTVCACGECKSACREKPGMCIPSDTEAFRDAFGLLTEDDWLRWAVTYRTDWDEERALREALVFRDHWLGAAGQKGVKADWAATWRNWIRRAT